MVCAYPAHPDWSQRKAKASVQTRSHATQPADKEDQLPEQKLSEEAAALLAVADPLERAAAITAYGRVRGNLPPALAEQRRLDLQHSRKTLSASKIAAYVRLARSGIFRLTATVAEEAS